MAAVADAPQGILLYYKYVDLDKEQQGVAEFYEKLCLEHSLRGRVRVAKDGVNVTLGGPLQGLRAHMDAVIAHPLLCGSDIDFKLQVSGGARNEVTQRETKMDGLSVRLCEELVTLGPLARHRADPRAHTAPHLTPQKFHDMLQRAADQAAAVGAQDSGAAAAAAAGVADAAGDGGDGSGVVLLDARNLYETRIGHFGVSPSVPTLDPRTRCFSDLPAWLDEHAYDKLAGRTVLMYCTGGVRCERASAYLREMGPAFSNVYQLQGGIQRYLEAFPDGGFFRGKNFLYDDRIAVGPDAVAPQQAVVGSCLLCGTPWDDYGERLRCSRCRLLLLVCDTCRAHGKDQQTQQGLVCELCRQQQQDSSGGAPGSSSRYEGVGEQGSGIQQQTQQQLQEPDGRPELRADGRSPSAIQGGGCAAPCGGTKAGASGGAGPCTGEAGGPRKLRILCLHGFRQTAKQFQGRTCALRKRLRDLADFVFVDGPHVLPFFAKEPSRTEGEAEQDAEQKAGAGQLLGEDSGEVDEGPGEGVAFALDSTVAGLNGARSEHGEQGESHAEEEEEESKQGDAAGAGGEDARQQRRLAGAKRAWLLPPELYGASAGAQEYGSTDAVLPAPEYVDEMQYTRQTEGWGESLEALRRALRELGPFDGVLGFSQGACVAAALCAVQQQEQQEAAASAGSASAGAVAPHGSSSSGGTDDKSNPLRFVILACGFYPPCPKMQSLLTTHGPVRLPSLHVYGSSPGADRQVGPRDSEELEGAFCAAGGMRRTVRHGSGHIIPTSKTTVAAIRSFLVAQQQQQQK